MEKKRTMIITGSGSGLGKEIYCAAKNTGLFYLIGLDIEEGLTVDYLCNVCDKSDWLTIGYEEFSVGVASIDNNLILQNVDILINNAGINFISPLERITEGSFDEIIDVNVKSILISSQCCLPGLIKNKGTIVNVVSNASHLPMTDSFAYNASKGASAIGTRQMARELTKKYGITVFGISPNKLAGTKMSRYIDETFPPMRNMTYEEGREYQLKGLLTGKETDPKQIADLLIYLLSEKERHGYLSGCILELGL